MNKKQLLKLGVPHDCVNVAVSCLQADASSNLKRRPKQLIPQLIAAPQAFLADAAYAPLARAVIAEFENQEQPKKIGYATWGRNLDAASQQQMDTACQLPIARYA